jgi:hypothetical protein
MRVAVLLAGMAIGLLACAPGGAKATNDWQAATSVSSFVGTWKHKGNIVAPWLNGLDFLPDPEPEIIEKPLVISETGSTGPSMLSCETATYTVTTSGLNELFEGNVTDPGIASSVLGIDKDKIPTLKESCKSATGDMELNYHLIGEDKMLLGLNNIVYQFERARP